MATTNLKQEKGMGMNPEVKAAWVTALRSGDYTQGKHALCVVYGEGVRYCCLGVLCDLAVKAGVGVRPTPNGAEVLYDGASLSLPSTVAEWAGLDDSSPKVPWSSSSSWKNTGDESLANLNDGADGPVVSFAEIADLIEAHL